jgi:uncharacterized protein
MTFSAQPMSTRGTSTTPPPPLPSSAPLASIGSVRELTEHHEVPSLKQLSLEELDVGQELRNACRRGDIELIKILVREGADPNSLVENCYENIADPIPILAYGCIKGWTSLVDLLLEKGAAPSYSMLEDAFYRRSDSIIALLKGKGVNIDTLQSDGYSLLHFACYHQELGQVERLINLGADVNHCAKTGETPLILAFSKPHTQPANTKRIMRMLLNGRAKTEVRWNERTPLLWACMLNNETAFSLLLEAGADRAAMSANGRTLLEVACSPDVSASIFCTLLDHEPKLRPLARELLDDFEDEQSILKLQYLRPAKRKRADSIDQTV